MVKQRVTDADRNWGTESTGTQKQCDNSREQQRVTHKRGVTENKQTAAEENKIQQRLTEAEETRDKEHKINRKKKTVKKNSNKILNGE